MNKVNDKNDKNKKREDIKDKTSTKKAQKIEPDSSGLKDKIIGDLKVKLKESEDRVLRELAENENLRKRHEKETQENLKYAIKNFSYDLLSVTDNFQRALSSISNEDMGTTPNLKNLVIGLQAVEKEIYEIFEKNGIKRFDSLKEKFNPEIHQAVSKKNSEFPEGVIIEELQKGFLIDERLLRPSMVVVSNGKEKSEKN